MHILGVGEDNIHVQNVVEGCICSLFFMFSCCFDTNVPPQTNSIVCPKLFLQTFVLFSKYVCILFIWEISNCKNEGDTHFRVNVTAVILFVIASFSEWKLWNI